MLLDLTIFDDMNKVSNYIDLNFPYKTNPPD